MLHPGRDRLPVSRQPDTLIVEAGVSLEVPCRLAPVAAELACCLLRAPAQWTTEQVARLVRSECMLQ